MGLFQTAAKHTTHVRISKYKNIFAKEYTPNQSGDIFVKEKSKILFYGHILLVIIRVKRLLELLIKKNDKNKQSLYLKKKLKKTVTNYISSGKILMIGNKGY